MSYQGATFNNCSSECCEKTKQEAMQNLAGLDNKMRERLAWSDTIILLRSLLVFLETQTWMKCTRTFSTDSLPMDDKGDEDCS